MCDFCDLDVGQEFVIPSDLNHEMERFKKLPFNKAISIDQGRVEHFPDHATVWVVEHNPQE